MILSFRSNKYQRWLLPILLAALIATALLAKNGIITGVNMKYLLIAPAVLELLFIILCLFNITRIIRRYRVLKQAGRDSLDALETALQVIASPRVARLAVTEFRLYYALYCSYRHRPSAHQFTTRTNSYGFLVKVIIFLCFLEILAVTWLLPNRWMTWKLVHLILGLWAILWLWSDYRAMGLYNNQISAEGMHFRLGLRYNQSICWNDILHIRRINQAPPGGALAPQMFKKHPGVFYLGAGEVCNIEVTLREARSFQGMINDFKGVTHLLLSLENPDGFIDRLGLIQPGLYSS